MCLHKYMPTIRAMHLWQEKFREMQHTNIYGLHTYIYNIYIHTYMHTYIDASLHMCFKWQQMWPCLYTAYDQLFVCGQTYSA